VTDADRDALDQSRLDDPELVDRLVTDAINGVEPPRPARPPGDAAPRPAVPPLADTAPRSVAPRRPPSAGGSPPRPVVPGVASTDEAATTTVTDGEGGGAGGQPPAAPDEHEEDDGGPSSERSGLRNLVEWILVIAGALVVALLIKAFLFQAFFIPSESMEPTLGVGDRVIVNKLSDGFGRGDLIVFEKPEGEGGGGVQDLIKRVVGLPGETVSVEGDQVYIDANDGQGPRPLDEPYLADGLDLGADYQGEPIPEGHVFVMGDNRDESRDSRFFGPVPKGDVVGRAFLRVWPPGDIGLL
jgi:signal peptidase I